MISSPATAAAWRRRSGMVWQVDHVKRGLFTPGDLRLRPYRALVDAASALSIPGTVDTCAFGPPPEDLRTAIRIWHAFDGVAVGVAADTMLRLTDGAWILGYFAERAADRGLGRQGLYLSCGFSECTRPAFRGYACGLGITFHPWIGRHLFGVPGSDIAQVRVPADRVWRPWGSRLLERLANARNNPERLQHVFSVVREAMARQRLNDLDLVSNAARTLARAHGNLRIDALARDLGVSARTLERRCTEHLGLGPKTFARVCRQWAVAKAAVAAEPTTWTDLALGLGYSDQAHCIREFTTAHGFTPRRFRELAGRRGITLGTYAFLPVDLASSG